jgi:rhodanese-related sulfurtransferase
MLLDSEVSALVSKAFSDNGVKLRTHARVDALLPGQDGVAIRADQSEFATDAAVVALGVLPVVGLARRAGVALGPTGAIAVDGQFRTSVPHLWACGDCAEVRHAVSGQPCHLPLGSLANRQGRFVADAIAGSKEQWPPVAGAAGLKVFDTHVAGVGLTRAQASALGMRPRSAWLCGYDRAHYYPEAQEIALQLVYEDETGRVLGVQAAGSGEVHKRIDTATQLLARRARLSDLAQIEHAYAPPYAPAIDPLAALAMVAQNQQQGLESLSPLTELEGLSVLDVRHTHESESRPVASSRAERLPQSELRAQAEHLKDQEWLVVCERGTRSAEVARWLLARGNKARYLGGGLRWRALAGL